jgi:biopolymer transport protein ExbD
MAMTDAIPVPAFVRPSARGRDAPPKRPRLGLFRASGEAGPIVEINTTPLVDVMLVLLIMFIITIPVASHNVPLDLPQPAPVQLAPRPFHQLDIAANGSLAWNGAPIAAEALQAQLAQLAADPATPELRLNANSEARYERIDQVLAQIRLAGVQRLGFVGNERFGASF